MMTASSPQGRLNRRTDRSPSPTLGGTTLRTQEDINDVSQIISSCNFLCDDNIDNENLKLTKIDRYLSRREKYMYERILAEVHH